MVRFHPALEGLLRPIDEAAPHPDNYNNGDLEAIAESIDENGMCDVVLVQTATGWIISGNHTWMVLKERQAEVCPMVMLDVNDLEASKIMVAMNVIPRRAKPDNAHLLATLQTLASRDTLTGTGISDAHLETLEALAEMPMSFERTDWPLLSIKVSPQMMKAFRDTTREAETDTDRFELLLRLAGAL